MSQRTWIDKIIQVPKIFEVDPETVLSMVVTHNYAEFTTVDSEGKHRIERFYRIEPNQ